MESYILETLPSIHGILLGIGVAFFSAFSLFAYQKLQETKDQLEDMILRVEKLSSPSNYMGGGNKLLKDDQLDWDGKAQAILRRAKSIYSYVDLEEKYGIKQQFDETITDEEILDTCQDLCVLFHYLFTTFPFNGKSMVYIKDLSEKVNQKKESESFTINRLKEIERRISFLDYCWNTNNKSILTLCQKASEIEQKSSEQRLKQLFDINIKDYENISVKERNSLWEEFYLPHINHQTNYCQIIINYFNKVHMYRDNVLPKLKDMIKTHEIFNNRFKIKSSIIIALNIFLYIFIFGIVLPLFIIETEKNHYFIWKEWLPFFLLFITIIPYLTLSLILYKKITKWSFR